MSSYGDKIRLTVFGESHGNGIGAVLDGVEAGHRIDMDKILIQMARRAPGKDKTATPRKEKDFPDIKSGMLNDTTTGAPICCVIENTNTKSGDYSNLLSMPRPGHSDYTAYVKYNGNNDIRGGGHFSGRLTAPIVFSGSVLRQILEEKGIKIAAHINSIHNVYDTSFNSAEVDEALMERLSNATFPLINPEVEEKMREEVEKARMNLDSVGGTIECIVTGLPAGLGGPLFEGVEGEISKAMFGIPAVKGIEFGNGFECAKLTASENNDPFTFDENGNVKTTTNNCGGILGGITNGMPLIFKLAIKPTPSIAQKQNTINLSTNENDILEIHGRHDPCIIPRAVPVVEAMTAVVIANLM